MTNAGLSSNAPNGGAFETETFAVPYFTHSERGFEFRTDHTIGRTGALSLEESLALESGQRDALRQGMKGEMAFAKSSVVSDARDAWRKAADEGADPERVESLYETYLGARAEYIQRGKKIGIRALRLEGDNTLTADVQIVSFPVFNQLAYPNSSPEVEKLSTGGGTSMMVRTADNRILIQHRAVQRPKLDEPGQVRGNATFCDVPGASAGGWLDASLTGEGRTPGTPDPINTQDIKNSVLKETAEELGLDRNDLSSIRIVGIARDKIRPADVFLLLADSGLTADQLKQRSHESVLNKGQGDADFEEKFIDIDGSVASIETLLAEVRCPFPPAHAANLLASGYYLVLQESGQEAADAWKLQIHDKIVKNYRLIDHMVREYYERYPEVYAQVPERFLGKGVPRRNSQGYEPAYTPQEQGLPSFEDEMVRTGLMPERRTRVDEAGLFDVDGMIDAVKGGGTMREDVLEDIVAKLSAGKPAGVTSAHSTMWLVENIVRPLQGRVSKDALKNFIAIGENGGTWATFNADGELFLGQSPTLKAPKGIGDQVHEIVQRYPSRVRLDDSKQTMISIEIVGADGDPVKLTQARVSLNSDLAALLESVNDDGIYEVTVSGRNVHIADRNAGKSLGAQRFLEFLSHRDVIADRVVLSSDGSLGIGTAEELERRQQRVELRILDIGRS